ncbi:hypothetical protein EJD97_012944 [Solanum chilense]|uniref:Reverse transcriptase/retrotransposon-derived protein RNase H-like domain-containing protein n=1 Tax=Solanum chilense TaxID=4083 RepID=A0A6N2BC39_SOLCI|nr:hypothetical protein EJD97_012944 [Solanum chilense]
MNTMRATIRRVGEEVANAVVPLQDMMAQANWEIGTPVNKNSSTMASHFRGFTIMNPPMFYWSKVNEDHQYFLDEVYKILFTMWVTLNEKVKKSTYYLKDVAQIWHRNSNRDAKRARHYDGGASKGKLKIQDNPRFKKRLSNQVPSNVSRTNKDRVLNPKAQGGTISVSQEVDPKKMNAVKNWPRPPKSHGFSKILGLARGLQELKDNLTSALVLTLSEGTEGFVVYCDASRVGLGCFLMPHGKVTPYFSRQLKWNGLKRDMAHFMAKSPNFQQVKAEHQKSGGLEVDQNLSYEDVPVEILDLQVKKLSIKEVASVKVLWKNHFVESATWEAEDDMMSR